MENKDRQFSSDELFKTLYDELRMLADARMKNERPGQTLQPTALVNEIYLKLCGNQSGSAVKWDSPRHFFGAAARAMRQVLIDRARTKSREKRGGGRTVFPLEAADDLGVCTPQELVEIALDLDACLIHIGKDRPDLEQILVLKLFAGRSWDEIASQLELPVKEVTKHFQYARARLLKCMSGGEL